MRRRLLESAQRRSSKRKIEGRNVPDLNRTTRVIPFGSDGGIETPGRANEVPSADTDEYGKIKAQAAGTLANFADDRIAGRMRPRHSTRAFTDRRSRPEIDRGGPLAHRRIAVVRRRANSRLLRGRQHRRTKVGQRSIRAQRDEQGNQTDTCQFHRQPKQRNARMFLPRATRAAYCLQRAILTRTDQSMQAFHLLFFSVPAHRESNLTGR